MPLDRAWFNTLVDDDGSNTVGSVWNKASVDALMDASDAALAPLEMRHVGARTVWVPNVHREDGTLCTVGTKNCSFHQLGDGVQFHFSLLSIAVAANTQALLISLCPGYVPSNATAEESIVRIVDTASRWGYCRTRDANWIELRREADGAFAAGTLHVVGSGFYYFR